MNTPLEFTKQLGRLQESSTDGNCVSPQSYAHTDPKSADPADWEPLFTADCPALKGGCCEACERMDRFHGHLNKVAWWTAKFAEAMFPSGSEEAKAARKWGYLAGLWHDLGKFHPDFQRKLFGEHVQIEHAGTGAVLSQITKMPGWEMLAFAIAGHHSGLANALAREINDHLTPLAARLKRAERNLLQCKEVTSSEIQSLLFSPPSSFPFIIGGSLSDPLFRGGFIRRLFSALVDADSLATEAFCSHSELKTRLRRHCIYDSLDILNDRLDSRLLDFSKNTEKSAVNIEREKILSWCREAAVEPPGFFQLNVPTGGGKTLSAMAFSLNHAVAHAQRGMRRVVIAVPYTSIIEQNADIYRAIFGMQNVIEHHSNLDNFSENDKEETELNIRRRLACENWDAPVIVTTNVQLFESLFSNKRHRARKIHNLAGSVIILDEAQCVPAEYLHLILLALRDLVENYGCTVVVSTATQPAWEERRSLLFGISSAQLYPIVPLDVELSKASAFDRVEIEWPCSLNPLLYEELAKQLAVEKCVMAIVHRKKDAQLLTTRLKLICPNGTIFHLSTNMCPIHRRQVLKQIRMALHNFRENGTPCRVISTQLVEAGVDLDFDVIYRALAGLDSIAQAAGRCNREGKLKNAKGRVVVFIAETEPPDGHLKHCAEVSRKMLEEYGGVLDLRNAAVFKEFFVRLYRDRNLDAKNLVRHARDLNFETLGREFRLIEEGDQTPVVVLFDEEARLRLRKVEQILQNTDESVAARYALRALQPYTISVYSSGLKLLSPALSPLFEGSSVFVLDPNFYEGSYDAVFGLVTDEEPRISPEKLIAA